MTATNTVAVQCKKLYPFFVKLAKNKQTYFLVCCGILVVNVCNEMKRLRIVDLYPTLNT